MAVWKLQRSQDGTRFIVRDDGAKKIPVRHFKAFGPITVGVNGYAEAEALVQDVLDFLNEREKKVSSSEA